MKNSVGALVIALAVVVLISGCSKKPGSVVEDFYKAKTWDEKQAFILDANGLKENDVYDEDAIYKIEDIKFLKKIDDASSVYKAALVINKNGKESKKTQKFLIKKVGENEKIDFKTMIGYNELSLDQFTMAQAPIPQKFWVRVDVHSVYYNLYKVRAVEVLERHSPGDYAIILTKNSTPDELKIYDIALANKNGKILIQTSKIVPNVLGTRVLQNVKLIQESNQCDED